MASAERREDVEKSESAPAEPGQLDETDERFLDTLGIRPIENTPIEDVGYDYYWDGQGEDQEAGVGRVVYDNSRWAGIKVVQGLEFVGQIAAHVLGLDQSQYYHVVDSARRERDEIARRILIEKQREMLLRDREATIRMSREQARKQVAESKEPSSPADDAESKGEPDLESGVAKVDPSSSGGAAAAAGGGSS